MPGCSAWVTVDDKQLPVYSATTEGNKSIGYIEAVEGAQFKVHWRDGRTEPPVYDYAAELYIDGRSSVGCVIGVDNHLYQDAPDDIGRVHVYSGAQITATSERPYQFSKLQLTDDDDNACQEEGVVKNMAILQVKILRVKDVQVGVEYSTNRGFSDVPLPLHEQAKKATLSHQTSLAPAQSVESRGYTHCVDIDPPENPFYTFEFRYRSRGLLELEGYAPGTFDATPLPLAHAGLRFAALPAPSPPPAVAAEDPPAVDAQPCPASAKAKGKKRAIEITIDSDDDDDAGGMTEVERLRAQVAELERERVKAEPSAKVKEEKKPSLKRVKMEQGGSNAAASSSPRGEKAKPEVIELD